MIFGIVGYGRFGKLWAQALTSFGEVMVYEKKFIPQLDNKKIKIITLPNLIKADIVFILTPISLFEESCKEIKKFLKPAAIIVDCCSVKIYPVDIMQKVFSNHQPLIATHPLFGPDSVKKNGGLSGHKIVVCPVRYNDTQLNQLITILKKMGLVLFITMAAEHDKQMATSQGLIHFIGRGLEALELTEQELATPDFIALLSINKMVINDTWQLFLDMHKYNPYTQEIRRKLILALNKIDYEINSQ